LLDSTVTLQTSSSDNPKYGGTYGWWRCHCRRKKNIANEGASGEKIKRRHQRWQYPLEVTVVPRHKWRE
jgi:hypothetical protein